MPEYGFFITQVRLTGQNIPEAIVDLQDGFNVIFGASNTGKTYIAQCIDYAFGRKDAPKAIPEARRYDIVHVQVEGRDSGESFTISRSLRGGNALTISQGEEEQIVKAIHSSENEDNISSILLKLCGLSNKKVAINGRGKLRSISFRDLSQLIVINEEKIIRSDSPIHSRRYSDFPAQQSIFRLLLTGTDDSSVIEQKEPKISRAENRGKGEVLERFESDLKAKIEAFDNVSTPDDLRAQRDRLDATIKGMSAVLDEQRSNLAGVEAERRRVWTELQRVESRQEVLSQLFVRFSLLAKQYESDLDRLASINEVGVRLGELKEERCPVCGATAEHHNEEHAEKPASPDAVAAAAFAEANKTRQLTYDLSNTIDETRAESNSLVIERDQLEISLRQVTRQLSVDYQPKMAEALRQYQDLFDEKSRLEQLLSFHERLEGLESLRSETEADQAVEGGQAVATKVTTDLAAPFCVEIERLLNEWQLPDRGRVTFSEDSQDIVIGDRIRRVDGKGIRAITHAAFSLALNNYCVDGNLPTASFVILDSPLVVYREPEEEEEGFTLDVKVNFYRQLAQESDNRQVIVFENDDPPSDLESSVNVIHFTKSEQGRYGFIPRGGTEPSGEEKW